MRQELVTDDDAAPASLPSLVFSWKERQRAIERDSLKSNSSAGEVDCALLSGEHEKHSSDRMLQGATRAGRQRSLTFATFMWVTWSTDKFTALLGSVLHCTSCLPCHWSFCYEKAIKKKSSQVASILQRVKRHQSRDSQIVANDVNHLHQLSLDSRCLWVAKVTHFLSFFLSFFLRHCCNTDRITRLSSPRHGGRWFTPPFDPTECGLHSVARESPTSSHISLSLSLSLFLSLCQGEFLCFVHRSQRDILLSLSLSRWGDLCGNALTRRAGRLSGRPWMVREWERERGGEKKWSTKQMASSDHI